MSIFSCGFIYEYAKSFYGSRDLDVCNCATLNLRKVSYDDLVKYAKKVIVLNPFENTIWAPGGGLTKCRYNNYLKVR